MRQLELNELQELSRSAIARSMSSQEVACPASPPSSHDSSRPWGRSGPHLEGKTGRFLNLLNLFHIFHLGGSQKKTFRKRKVL